VGPKTQFLQIRVTAEQKATLQRVAAESGQDVSAFVLSRVLPAARIRFAELVEAARHDDDRRYVLAELNDLLSALPASTFADAVAHADLRSHPDLTANYVAAMVEHAAARHGIDPPEWTRKIEVLEHPYFAADLPSLRPWLLAASPTAFKRRNLFVDSSLGDRV
jgi:uncharacterized protein (DUF1778 family)